MQIQSIIDGALTAARMTPAIGRALTVRFIDRVEYDGNSQYRISPSLRNSDKDIDLTEFDKELLPAGRRLIACTSGGYYPDGVYHSTFVILEPKGSFTPTCLYIAHGDGFMYPECNDAILSLLHGVDGPKLGDVLTSQWNYEAIDINDPQTAVSVAEQNGPHLFNAPYQVAIHICALHNAALAQAGVK